MNMVENAMVLGEYDPRPEMTDADMDERVEEIEQQLVTDRREELIEDVENSDFARKVVGVLLSESDDKLGELRDMLNRHIRSHARWLADQE